MDYKNIFIKLTAAFLSLGISVLAEYCDAYRLIKEIKNGAN